MTHIIILDIHRNISVELVSAKPKLTTININYYKMMYYIINHIVILINIFVSNN